MAKDYSGLNPRSIMGGMSMGLDGSGLSIGSLWTDQQILQVERTMDNLRQSGELSTDEINQSVSCLKKGVHHPTWQGAAKECIGAIYDFSTTNEQKANIISQLLEPSSDGHNYVGVIADLLEQEDGVRDRLGPGGVGCLLNIATERSPFSRSTQLANLVMEGYRKDEDSDSGIQENRITQWGEGGGPATGSWRISLAAANRNTEEIAELIPNSGMDPTELKQLSQSLADQYGQDLRPIFQKLAMNGDDTSVRQFGFDGLMRLATNHGATGQATTPLNSGLSDGSQGLQQNNELVQLSTLKDILNGPGITPNSLVARVGFSPKINAMLIQIILGN